MVDHSSEIVEAFTQIAREKNIEKDELNLIIEEIFKMMIKKKFGTTDNFDVIVNLDKAAIEIYQTKKVVDQVEDPITQISLQDAKKVEPEMDIDDDFIDVVDPASFGRRLIISARQTLNQKIRDIERKLLLDEFNGRKGEIIVGEIRQINRNEIFVSFERAELTMPRMEQIPNERYKRGETVRALVKDVLDDPRGPRIVISRADANFLIRLFENEVPEIYDGIIEIKAIARDPGERTKIAVYSNDKRIDAVGACVGMKGVRIQAIVKELNNEKIDIISWSQDPEILIARALSPAKPLRIEVDTADKKALAVINDDEMSIAVGRFGQNINLASRLTGYEIETIKYSDLSGSSSDDKISEESVFGQPAESGAAEETATEDIAEPAEDEKPKEDQEYTPDTTIEAIKGVSKDAAELFAAAGFKTLADIADVEDLRKVEGVTERSMNKLIAVHEQLHTTKEQ